MNKKVEHLEWDLLPCVNSNIEIKNIKEQCWHGIVSRFVVVRMCCSGQQHNRIHMWMSRETCAYVSKMLIWIQNGVSFLPRQKKEWNGNEPETNLHKNDKMIYIYTMTTLAWFFFCKGVVFNSRDNYATWPTIHNSNPHNPCIIAMWSFLHTHE